MTTFEIPTLNTGRLRLREFIVVFTKRRVAPR